VLGVADFVVMDVRGAVVRRSLLLVSCSHNGIVELEHLLAELIVLLICVLDLADSVSDRLSNLLDFLLGVLVLAAGFGEFLSKVVSLFLEERDIRPLLVVGVAVRPLPSIVVLG
jgi:hypothetical protein